MRRRTSVGMILASAFAVACGGGDGGNPMDPGPTPDFTMSVSPTSLQLVLGSGVPSTAGPGESVASEPAPESAAAQMDVSFMVTIVRAGGFTGAVTIAVEGLPAGVTATALVIGSGQTSGTVTLSAGASAGEGTSTATVRGSATGVTAKTQSLSLQLVLPPSSGETFDLDFTSANGSVAQGSGTSLTLEIDRSGGFTGDVTLTASSDPAGLGLTFDPATTSGTSSSLEVSAGVDLAPGDYTVTATGTGGDLEITATLVVTVTASGGGGGGELTIHFCPENGLPVWFARQDGTGPWARIEEGDPGVYTFDMDSGMGGVAFVALDENDHATVVVYYGSRDEIDTFYGLQCATEPGKMLTGSLAGVGPGEIATVSLGGAAASVIGSAGPLPFMLEDVREGPTDLLASLTVTQSDGMGGFESVLKRGVIRRGTDYSPGSMIPLLDFTTEGFDPVRYEVTVTNTLGHVAAVSATYLTATSSAATLFANPLGGTHYFGVPPSEQADGDLHVIAVGATENTMSLPVRTRNVGVYQKLAEDLTVDLGPVISPVAVTIEATVPYVRPRVQFAIQDEYDRFWSAGFAGASGNAAQIAMFEGYDPGSSFDRTLPDFSPLDGFDPDWGLRMEMLFYNAIATGWESEGGIAEPTITEGGISRAAAENGTITP